MTTNKPDIATLLDAIESGYLNEKILTKAIANRSDAAAAKVGDNLTDWLIGFGGLLLAVTYSMIQLPQQASNQVDTGTTSASTQAPLAATSQSITPSKGFIKPLNAPITSGFGPRNHPVLGYSRPHNGLDFGAVTGTPIKAVAAGVVLRAGNMGQCGNGVVIDHKNGYETTYCHASTLSVKAGQTVTQGQTIAAVGSTGLSTGPHLHFGVKQNGTWINPALILGGAK